MRLSLRMFIAWFALVGLGMLLLLYSTFNQLHPVLRQTSEEALVDTANLLAEMAHEALHAEDPAQTDFARALRRYSEREFDARIWSRHKTDPGLQIYLTDAQGRVVFHTDEEEIDKNYSTWLDVSRTLEGQYGARTTPSSPEKIRESVMYVAAPVYQGDERIGVVTVGQPNESIQPFLDYVQSRILQLGSGILLAALVLGGLLAFWLTASIRRLVRYVDQVRDGQNPRAPVIRERELARLARSTESMRREIEGKQYVEHYIQNLTHEMKSPLSAIRGAVEILEEPALAERDRTLFTQNIREQSGRMQQLIDRLLSLASLENRHGLGTVETLDANDLIDEQLEARQAALKAGNIRVERDFESGYTRVRGERFLLQQALGNLLDNAIDFCRTGGRLSIHLQHNAEGTSICIFNEGQPIPDYALPRLLERFYSLERPETGRKSTGLGLSFVREIAELHGGCIHIRNAAGGVESVLTLPDRNQRSS